MLMQTRLRKAERKGKLIRARPFIAWAAERRAFWMTKTLYDQIESGKSSSDPKVKDRWAKLEADITTFVEGGYAHGEFIKQLDPPKFEHWELKSVAPRPGIRIFGRFALPDVFVGTHAVFRCELGKKWSVNFELNKLKCEEEWNNAGLPKPFTAAPDFEYTKYITFNAGLHIGVPQ